MVRRYVNVSKYVVPERIKHGVEKGVDIVLDFAVMELTFSTAAYIALCFYL